MIYIEFKVNNVMKYVVLFDNFNFMKELVP